MKKTTDGINELVAKLEGSMEDAEKFDDKGNASAGKRIRATLQDVAKRCKEIRQEIQSRKNKSK